MAYPSLKDQVMSVYNDISTFHIVKFQFPIKDQYFVFRQITENVFLPESRGVDRRPVLVVRHTGRPNTLLATSLQADDKPKIIDILQRFTTTQPRMKMMKKDINKYIPELFLYNCLQILFWNLKYLLTPVAVFELFAICNPLQDISMKSREKQWANRLAVSTSWFDDEESDEEIADQEYKVCADFRKYFSLIIHW